MTEGEIVKYAMVIVLVAIMAAIGLSLRAKDRSPSKYSLEDLLIGPDGRASKTAHITAAAFLMTTWVIVYLTLRNRLDAEFYWAYLAAWVAPKLVQSYKGKE